MQCRYIRRRQAKQKGMVGKWAGKVREKGGYGKGKLHVLSLSLGSVEYNKEFCW